VVSDVSLIPAAYLPGLSSYVTSKLAQAKIFEFIAAENPTVFVATLNPGMIETANFRRTGGKAEGLPMDTGKITQFQSYLVSVWVPSIRKISN
jgi:short-subunit dehydrogenase